MCTEHQILCSNSTRCSKSQSRAAGCHGNGTPVQYSKQWVCQSRFFSLSLSLSLLFSSSLLFYLCVANVNTTAWICSTVCFTCVCMCVCVYVWDCYTTGPHAESPYLWAVPLMYCKSGLRDFSDASDSCWLWSGLMWSDKMKHSHFDFKSQFAGLDLEVIGYLYHFSSGKHCGFSCTCTSGCQNSENVYGPLTKCVHTQNEMGC